MGDWIQVTYFGGKVYLEWCGNDSEWQTEHRELQSGEIEVIEEFMDKQSQERDKFLSGFKKGVEL